MIVMMPTQVSEATAPGSALPLPAAVDPDGPPYGVDRYELASTSDAFQLRVTRVDDDAADAGDASFDLRLVLARPLDREDASSYRLTVLAVDGGQPGRTGSLDVRVIVEDVNDNRPVFEQASTAVSLYLPTHGSIPKRPKTKTAQTKTAHTFLTCPKRPTPMSKTVQRRYKTAQSYDQNGPQSVAYLAFQKWGGGAKKPGNPSPSPRF